MTIMQVIFLAISASICLMVFGLGLNSRPMDLIWLFRRPGLLVRSILSMNVLMVIIAVAIALTFHVSPAVKIAIIALALSPVPPMLPKKQYAVGGKDTYVIGLLAAVSFLSILLVPGWLKVLGSYFGYAPNLALGKVTTIVLTKILAPLVVGMLVKKFAPKFAGRIVKPVSIVATVLLVVSVLPVLFFARHAMWAMVGNGVLIAMVVFALAGILLGHLLGGPDMDNRSVLALASSTRHPGIAFAIASLNFPEHRQAVLVVIVFHLIVGGIVAIPYVKWRKRHHAAMAAKHES